MRHTLPEAGHPARVAGQAASLVAALGNPVCGDDGAGTLVVGLLESLGVAERVRLERVADPLLLLELWDEEDDVILVDAARAALPSGTHLELDGRRTKLPGGVHPVSSHGIGLAEVLALGRRLGRLPRSITIHAVVGREFGQGTPMTDAVWRAAERLALALRDELGGEPAPA